MLEHLIKKIKTMENLKNNRKKIEAIEEEIFNEYGKEVHKQFFQQIIIAGKKIKLENLSDEDFTLRLFLVANTLRCGLMN